MPVPTPGSANTPGGAVPAAQPEAVLRADANTAWSPRQAVTSLELLADDPFHGVEVVDGRLVLPTGPGLGVERISESANQQIGG